MRFMTLVAATVLIVAPRPGQAQSRDSLNQNGRSILAMGLGLSGTRDATINSGQTSVHSTGLLGSLAFTHFVSSSVALEAAGALLNADAAVDYSSQNAEAVTVLLLGFSYSPQRLAVTTSIRPFLSAAFGSYVYSKSQTSTFGSVNASVVTHPGARLGAGANFYFARHVALQLETDYHAVGSFASSTGELRDPSGLTLTAGLAFAWGSR